MLVEVGRFLVVQEAHILRSRLVAEGLFATVIHDQHPQVAWLQALAFGGVKVLALREQLNDVQRVLARCRADELKRELEREVGDLDDLHCPRCGSTRLTSSSSAFRIVLSIALLLTLWLLVPVRANRHRCETCGARRRGHDGPVTLPA